MAKNTLLNNSKALAVLCARVAEEKKAEDIRILELSEIDGSPSDYFVVVTVQSDPQVKAVSDEMNKRCKAVGMQSPRIEGMENQFWVILDYFDVVLHIMKPDAREFYRLEKLWSDAPAFTLSPTSNRLLKYKPKRTVKATGKSIEE